MQYSAILERMCSALESAPHKARALVAAPYSAEIIESVERVYQQGYLEEVVLVGDESKIPQASDHFTRVDIDNPAEIASFVAEEGNKAGGLVIKGNISSSTLLRAVLKGSGGRHVANHVYAIQSRAFPEKTVVVADAGVNIQPDLKVKAEIIKNTVGVAHKLGFATPRVALVSAVESINPAMQSTLDAAALKVMGERGALGQAYVDGPMAFDAAMMIRSAEIKGLVGPVAGQADVLVLDDIEAANSTSKSLIGVDGDAMGVVVSGGKVVAFPSRGDSAKTRHHSLLLAAYLSISC
jgi:phosphotransacetylase